MDSRPVFVLMTATTCPACVRFKNNTWDSLKKELERQGKCQVKTIEVPTPQSKPPPNVYHKDIARFIGWWPTMSLFPADRWYNHNSELIGIVKNGKLVPPSKVKDPNTGKERTVPEHVELVGRIDLSKEDILKWVDYTLANDRIFSNNRKPVVHNPPAHNPPPQHAIPTQKTRAQARRLKAFSHINQFQPSRVK